MVVCHDVAVTAEDHAGADALRLDRVVEPVARDRLVRNADDRRADRLCRTYDRCIARLREPCGIDRLRRLHTADRVVCRCAHRAAAENDKGRHDSCGYESNPLAPLASDVHRNISFSHNNFCPTLRQTALYIERDAA